MAELPKSVSPIPKGASPIAKADDRRLFARQEVREGFLEFGTTGSAKLMDIGEAGMSVQSPLPFNEHDFLTVRFRLSESDPWIEAKGRLAWLSKSQKQAGVEFVELSDVARAQIRLWMEKVAAGESVADTPRGTQASALSYPAGKAAGAAPWQQWLSMIRTHFVPLLKERPLTAAMALSVLFAFFLVAYRLRSPQGQSLPSLPASHAARVHETANAPGGAALLPSGAIVGSALTLQVAAMRSRENAESLVATLQQENFSVFISQPAGARLFFVMVGPFQTQTALETARQELKQKGFDTIVREQSP